VIGRRRYPIGCHYNLATSPSLVHAATTRLREPKKNAESGLRQVREQPVPYVWLTHAKCPKYGAFGVVAGAAAAAGATRGLQRGGAKAGTVARHSAPLGESRDLMGSPGAGHPESREEARQTNGAWALIRPNRAE
jgi:hypothetical protein